MGVAERGKKKGSRKKAGGEAKKKRKRKQIPSFLLGNGKEGESITLLGGGGERTLLALPNEPFSWFGRG